jgi:hypothetical protein
LRHSFCNCSPWCHRILQVVIDKVLYIAAGTLDVLVMDLITISSSSSSWHFADLSVRAHDTNRIDVELGARLFTTQFALPWLFQARRGIHGGAGGWETSAISHGWPTLVIDDVLFSVVMFLAPT